MAVPATAHAFAPVRNQLEPLARRAAIALAGLVLPFDCAFCGPGAATGVPRGATPVAVEQITIRHR